MSVSTIPHNRSECAPSSQTRRFVGRQEFIELLVSYRKLERFEEKAGRVQGLLDTSTGRCYLITTDRLYG